MKNAILVILAALFLASCASSKLPAAPEIGGYSYYDSAALKLLQEETFRKIAKREGRKFVSKKAVAVVGIAVFGTYCILAWRYDIE